MNNKQNESFQDFVKSLNELQTETQTINLQQMMKMLQDSPGKKMKLHRVKDGEMLILSNENASIVFYENEIKSIVAMYCSIPNSIVFNIRFEKTTMTISTRHDYVDVYILK